MRRPSLTWRLTALFATAAALALLLLGQVIGQAVDRHFRDMDRAELAGKLELARTLLARAERPEDLDALPGQLADALIGNGGVTLLIQTADGRHLFATAGAPYPAPPADWAERAATASATAPAALLDWHRDTHPWRGLATRLPTGIPGGQPVVALAALDIHHHRAFLDAFHTSLWLAVAATLAGIALLGWLAARRGLAPVRDMAAIAQDISAERLHHRLPVDRLPAELAGLGTAFNDMLTRLEDAFRRLSEFSSDLAHELRTPISNLVTQTQVALAQPRPAEEYREVLYSSLEEYDRLSRMIADMLFLAKADNGLMIPNREDVALADEVAALFEFYEALAEENGLRLNADGQATVQGDRLMLRRALANLLANAIAHTPRGGNIDIQIAQNGGETRIDILNPGPDIAPEHLPRLFDRFYRADPARRTSHEGVGLGLAITRSIIQAHGGRIAAASGNGTTRFTITLPATPD